MEKLLLLGAGGMCREVIDIIKDINLDKPRYEIVGILDDDPGLSGSELGGIGILGTIEEKNIPIRIRTVLCIATHRNIGLRASVGNRLALEPSSWATLIHPHASVAASSELAPGTIIYPGARVAAAARMGLNSFLYYNAVLHHDSRIGDYTQTCAGVLIAGNVTVGNRCYLGIGSVLRDGVSIGDDSLVAMGAVVTTSAGASAMLKGVPARSA